MSRMSARVAATGHWACACVWSQVHVHPPRTFATLPPERAGAQEPASVFTSGLACICPVGTRSDHSVGRASWIWCDCGLILWFMAVRHALLVLTGCSTRHRQDRRRPKVMMSAGSCHLVILCQDDAEVSSRVTRDVTRTTPKVCLPPVRRPRLAIGPADGRRGGSVGPCRLWAIVAAGYPAPRTR